jgi:hypothetical protein
MCRYWCLFVCLLSLWCSAMSADAAALTELKPAVVNNSYEQQITITVSGTAPFTYALGGEEKPDGLSIDPQTGLLHGTPTATAVGTHRVRIIVTDYKGKQITQDFLLHITVSSAPPPAQAGTSAPPSAVPPSSPPPQPAVKINGTPSISSATSGLKTVSVNSTAFPAGVDSSVYKLYALDPGQTCAAGQGNALALAANTTASAKSLAPTLLQLAEALKDNTTLCAEESFKNTGGKEVATAYSKLFTVTGSPSVAMAVAGAKTLAITSPAYPVGTQAANYKLFTVEAGKVCTDTGTALPIMGAGATASKASTVTLTNPLVEKSDLCVAESFEDDQKNVFAVAYSSPIRVGPAIGSPTISPVSAGSVLVSITSPPFPSGSKSGTYGLYTVDPNMPCVEDGSKQLTAVPGTSLDAKDSSATTLTLSEALKEGTILCAVEKFKDDKGNDVAKKDSNLVSVASLEANWGRVRAYFVGGLLITNDSSSFSSAHQFYALNVEKTWRLPHCYLGTVVDEKGKRGCIAESSYSTFDLSGGTMDFDSPIYIDGASGKAGPPFEITNATVTVSSGQDITTPGGTTIHLEKNESFTVASGTLTGVLSPNTMHAATVGKGTLKITKGLLATAKIADPPAHWLERVMKIPGVTSYFETRLTAIPVVSNSTNTTCTPATGTTTSTSTGSGSSMAHASTAAASCSTGSSGSGSTAAQIIHATAASGNTNTSSTTGSFLTSQQTANVGVGVYLPFLLSRWNYKNTPNALFIAPIGKIGFNTITGATAQTVVLPANGGTGTQTLDQIYNFYDYGFRVGHLGLTNTTQVAPELYSYLDFSLGRFSNLESLICHRPDQHGASVTGSGCAIYGSQYTFDSRKRLYRIDIEGLLKIPNTLFYVGLNANIGQKQVMAEKLDPNFAAPNDLRFLFGTKFDIAQLFSKLGVKQ